MNKAFKLLFALVFPFTGFAQNTDSTKWKRFPNLFDNPYKKFEAAQIIGIQSSGIISGNKISNKFMFPFLLGGKLEKETIDQNLSNSKNKQLNIEINNEIRYVNLKKNKTLNWYIKGGTHSRTYANISNDAMKLVFKGNAGSQDYQFSNCSFYNLNLYKIGAGIYYHVEKTAHPFNLSIGLFAIQAINYINIKTYEKNYLQGGEDSFKIGANYEASFASSNSFSANGLGLGSEIIFNQKISDRSTWGFKFENFGFANFNEKVSTYSGNGEYSFDGFYIAEINRLKEEDYFKNQLDSFTNPLTNKKENQTETLVIAPSSFIYYNVHLKSAYYQIGLRHSGTKALPVAELRYFTFIKSSLLFGVTAGTIGQYYLNTDINWAIGRHCFVQAGIYHLEALALPKTFGGLGGNFGLVFVF